MWYIKKCEILSLIPTEKADEIREIFSVHKSIKKNTLIYQPKDISEYVYLVKKGSVRLMRLANSGQQITLSIFKEGMIFGEGDVLNEKTYSHFAETLENSSICYIKKADFKELLKKYPEVNNMILNILYRHWKEAQEQIENLAFHDVKERLVSTLLRFSNEYGKEYNKDGLQGTLINLKISQDKLADFCSTSRESVNRNIKELKSNGLIDLVGRNILLHPEFFKVFDVYNTTQHEVTV
ncbi:MAG: Crp/Fnr family transcriptional regulator [Bacillus sp. (in: Bacteria)]|nr:Crp/Fnr family transcriptional regulator [Bacillus sp. (in: firmicutes)]